MAGTITPYETTQGKRYRVRYRKPDKSQTDKRGFRTKREAELFLATIEVSKARGEYVDPSSSRTTIGELGPVWLSHQSHLKPSSLRPVKIAWRIYVEPEWGNVAAGDVKHSDVQAWVTELSKGDAQQPAKSATTILRVYGVLAGILDTAVKDRRLTSNVARGVNLPRKVKKEHRYLTHNEVHRLAEECGDKSTLVLLLAYTGLRWGEAIGLRVKDLDMLRRRINVAVNAVEVGSSIEVGTPKTHKRRSVPFPQFLAVDLAKQSKGKERDALLFATTKGTHLRRTASRGWFAPALERANVGHMTFHDLRHTAASLAISAGANVKAVQRMLGHASAAMTLDTYSDLFDDDLDVVAERLDHAARDSVVGKTWARAGNLK